MKSVASIDPFGKPSPRRRSSEAVQQWVAEALDTSGDVPEPRAAKPVKAAATEPAGPTAEQFAQAYPDVVDAFLRDLQP